MRTTRWAGLLVLTCVMATGCREQQADQAPTIEPQPTPVTDQMRQRIASLAPDALVGTVIAVLPEERMAAVGQIPVNQFRRGDVLTFLGEDRPEPITHGTVVDIVNDTLHVEYQPVKPDSREPAAGDLAIRFRP